MELRDIYARLDLSDSEIARMRHEAIVDAIDCGKREPNKKMQSDTWSKLDEIADEVWDSSSLTIEEKVGLGIQLYETFPSYYHFLVPFYRLIRDRSLEDQALKARIWRHFMEYLGGEPHLADPVGYVLWVEFFEDPNTVQESWQGLMNYSKNRKSLVRLLESCGPVPFELKEQLYLSLLKDVTYHDAILHSLLMSTVDLYGQIDKRRTGLFLSKLKVDHDSETFLELRKRLV